MNRQSTLDLIAGSAILIMFIGAFILAFSLFGFVLMGAGGIVMLFLFMTFVRKES